MLTYNRGIARLLPKLAQSKRKAGDRMMTRKNQKKCPYCQGVKRIRDDLVHYTFRHILQIENGDELWSTVITNKNEYRTMAYIEYCPKCGRKLAENEN